MTVGKGGTRVTSNHFFAKRLWFSLENNFEKWSLIQYKEDVEKKKKKQKKQVWNVAMSFKWWLIISFIEILIWHQAYSGGSFVRSKKNHQEWGQWTEGGTRWKKIFSFRIFFLYVDGAMFLINIIIIIIVIVVVCNYFLCSKSLYYSDKFSMACH